MLDNNKEKNDPEMKRTTTCENMNSMFNPETLRLLKIMEELFLREYYQHVDIYREIIDRYSLYYRLLKLKNETPEQEESDRGYKEFETFFNKMIMLSASRLGEPEREELIKNEMRTYPKELKYIENFDKLKSPTGFDPKIYKEKVLLQSFINIDISFESIDTILEEEIKEKGSLKVITKVLDKEGNINFNLNNTEIIEIDKNVEDYKNLYETIRDYYKIIFNSNIYPLAFQKKDNNDNRIGMNDLVILDNKAGVIRIKINHLPPIPRHFDAAFLGITTEIEGLDKLFGGKWLIPAYFSVVISINGEAGTGKTIFTLQVCSAFAKKKSLVIYLTLEQKAKELENIMRGFGFDCIFATYNIEEKEYKIRDISIDKGDKGIILFIKIDRFTIWELLETFNNIIEADDSPRACEKNVTRTEWLNNYPRKFLVVDTLNAVDGFDANDHKWRQNLSNFIDRVDDFKFSTIFLNEKKKEDPDNFVDYISDFVFRLHKTVEEVSGLRIETRHFEVTKSRMQYAHFGESTFIIRKTGIKIYPNPYIMTENHPTQKNVVDPDKNPAEYGIKINGVMDFFKNFHSKDRLMKPFWYKNSFTLLEGSMGSLKSNFAKFIVKSAFRDETWIDADDEQIEFDYRYEEVDKPQYEILKILGQGGKPIEKKIGLLVLFGEDFKYSERYDLIWETSFGKIIIPNCKSEEGQPKRFVHVSIIVIQFKISSYLSNVYLSIIEKVTKAVELFKIHEEVPSEYKNFIDPTRREYNVIGENLKSRRDSLFYLIFNPFKYIYTPKYFRKEYKDGEKVFSIEEKNKKNGKSIAFWGESKFFNKKLEIQFNDSYYNKFEKLLKRLAERDWNKEPEGNDDENVSGGSITSIMEKTLTIIQKVFKLFENKSRYSFNKVLIAKIKERGKLKEIFEYIEEAGETYQNESILLDLLFLIKRRVSDLKLEKIVPHEEKIPGLDLKDLEKFLPFFTLLNYIYLSSKKIASKGDPENREFWVNFEPVIRFAIIVLVDDSNNGKDENTLSNLKYFRKLRWDSLFYDIEIERTIGDGKTEFQIRKKIGNEYINYENAKFIKVSRIVVDDLVKVGKAFPMVKDEEFLPILYSFCLSNFISLFVVNTLISKDEKTDFDIQAESLAHTILHFDEIVYQGNSYKVLSIKKSSSRFHNIKTFEIIKKEEEILQVRSTFDLLITLETRPELLKIRLFLYEGSQLNTNTPFRMLLPGNQSFRNIPDIMPIREAKYTGDNKDNKTIQFNIGDIKNHLHQYNNFLVESLKFNLGHPEIEYLKNPKFFSDINLTFTEEIEFAEGVIGIIMIQDYRLHCNGTKLKKLSYYIKITDQNGGKIFLKENKDKMLPKLKIVKDITNAEESFLFGISEYYHTDFEGCIDTDSNEDGSQNSTKKMAFLKSGNHFLPDILHPVVYRDYKYEIVKREKDYGKKEKEMKKENEFCHFIALPYYMDPGVLLIEIDQKTYNNYLLNKQNTKNINNEQNKEEENPFCNIKEIANIFGENFAFNTFRFTHRTADDLMGFLIELLINIQGNKIAQYKDKQFICIKKLLLPLIANIKGNFVSLICKLGKFYDPFSEDEYNNENIKIRREWYSTAVEKIRIFRQCQPNGNCKKRYIIAPLGEKSVTINWYLALLKGSSREEIGAKIISHLCSPENSIKMMQNGIGMSHYEDVYSFGDKDKYKYKFVEMSLDAVKTGDIVRNSISLAKFPCYHRIASLVGMFFHQLLSRIKELTDENEKVEQLPSSEEGNTINDFVSIEFKGILAKVESLCDHNCPCFEIQKR